MSVLLGDDDATLFETTTHDLPLDNFIDETDAKRYIEAQPLWMRDHSPHVRYEKLRRAHITSKNNTQTNWPQKS